MGQEVCEPLAADIVWDPYVSSNTADETGLR